MLNQYHYKGGKQTTRINAVSGTLVKNHPNSFFKRFHLQSDLATEVFSTKPHIFESRKQSWNNKWADEKVSIHVLQVMVVGDMEVLAEIVREEDYQVEAE